MDRKLEERMERMEKVLGIGEGMDKFFSYPSTGGTVSMPVGENTVDFLEGRVTHADDHSKYYALSETLAESEYVRSYAVEPNRDIIVYTDQNKASMHTVKAGQYFRLPFQKFRKLFINCTETTSLYVLGHTNPNGVPTKFSVTTETMASNVVKVLALSTTENSVDFGTVCKGFYITYIDCDCYLDFDRTAVAGAVSSPFFKTASSGYMDMHCHVVHGITDTGTGNCFLIGVY